MITPNPLFSLARAFLGMTVMALSLAAGPNSDARESEFLQEIQTERGSDRIEVPPNRRGTNSGETVEDRQPDRSGPFRKVRVGLYNNKPKIFANEAGRPSGIFVDLLDGIARKEKWELIYVPCSWPECIQGLKAGRIDLMPDVAYSMEREDEFAFHDEPVIESWSQVYSNRKAGVAKLSDLNGLRIALLDGSIQQKILQNTIVGFGYQATFVSASSFEEAFRLTADGAADAVATNHLFGDYYFEEYGLVKTPIAFNPTSLYFAAANGRNPDLLEALDRNLRAMKSAPKSIYYQTLGRWMERPQPPVTVLPRHLIWVMGGIGGFLILTIIAVLMLRMQVRAQTRHLVQANELLKESEEKYTALYETSRDGIALLNTEGNFRQANRAFLEMTGYEMLELEGLSFHKLTPEKWRDKDRCIMEQQVQIRGYSEEYEKECVRRNGSVFPVAVRVWLMKNSSGNPFGMWMLMRDLTEQHLLLVQRIMTEKMTAVGMTAAGIAHELNNPLMGIQGFIDYCLKHTPAEDRRHEILKDAKRETLRCIDLVQNLLAFSHAGRLAEAEWRKESFEAVLNRVTGLLAYRIEKEGVQVIKQFPGNMPEIWTQGNHLQQVLLNLTTNALDAVRETEKKEIRFEALPAGPYVQISVSDSGTGIDPEHMQRIFDPFFTTKPAGRGTGLGLPVSLNLVESQGGKIVCESRAGKGTTFKILLPREKRTG